MKLIFRAAAGALLALASIANARADTPWKLVKTYPHDAQAFTEGLFYLDGTLYESTGLNGQSQIRQVELKSGRVLRKVDLERRYFGEGIVNWGDRLISLTWRHHQGFVWRLTDFQQLSLFAYPGEGWALTQDGQNIIMSDGTAELRFLNPYTMDEVKRITVTWNGQPVERLNELEWVKGEIYANV